ncbi:hypothetical protein MSG28_010012 [Choristoneura fumiferana]|uniref:Uncharacterized protein n=1 Tax=Choristoneura fumiferana TaxID=7141 RepID=A0ACC0KJV2_CHOFU|nr:hypothetical protein MSG28_010012 [Choristoneura fumiferana]
MRFFDVLPPTCPCLTAVPLSPGGAASRRRRARVPRVPRAAQLRLSCRELRVRLVRKRFRVQNTGSAPLAVSCAGGGGGGRAWRLVRGEPRGGLCGCSCVRARGERRPQQDMLLEPRSSTATLPLMLEVEYPQLFLEPAALDFGFVADGDTRKTYFTVWHSS